MANDVGEDFYDELEQALSPLDRAEFHRLLELKDGPAVNAFLFDRIPDMSERLARFRERRAQA